MKILIAEDDPFSRHLLETILTKWGYSIISRTNGDDAWDTLQLIDEELIVILDWMMPGKDGIALCHLIREQQPTFIRHIILLTARSSLNDLVAGLEAGADDFIVKPFDNKELRVRINAAKRIVDLEKSLRCRVAELETSLEHVKTLQGLLPICSHCHHIRNDQDVWMKIEDYLYRHTEISLSHGICPDCMIKYYGDYLRDLSIEKGEAVKPLRSQGDPNDSGSIDFK